SDIAWIISHNEVLFSHILPEIQASFKDLKQFLSVCQESESFSTRWPGGDGPCLKYFLPQPKARRFIKPGA
ncbi:hypothetical protein, partial [Lacticaseibacillus rhamnosus]|uniref:hypothetical protein n=1 Tax=Lacticaseibacillus rhamnosus TaxID=47715 RepID=UPI0021A46051